MAERFDVSADWLLFGKGAMRGIAENMQSVPIAGNQAEDALIRIPMVETVLSAGTGSLETSGQMGREYAFRRDFIQRKGKSREHGFDARSRGFYAARDNG